MHTFWVLNRFRMPVKADASVYWITIGTLKAALFWVQWILKHGLSMSLKNRSSLLHSNERLFMKATDDVFSKGILKTSSLWWICCKSVVMIWLLTKASSSKRFFVEMYFQIGCLFHWKIHICIFSSFDKLNFGLHIFEVRCKKWAQLIVVNRTTTSQ